MNAADSHRKDSNTVQPRIVAVDDDDATLRVILRTLARAGYTDVTGFTSPTECLANVRQRRPDLLLLDLEMPFHNGIELMRLINGRIPTDVSMAALMISGGLTPEARQLAAEGGVRDFLGKPFVPSELARRVQALLASSSRPAAEAPAT